MKTILVLALLTSAIDIKVDKGVLQLHPSTATVTPSESGLPRVYMLGDWRINGAKPVRAKFVVTGCQNGSGDLGLVEDDGAMLLAHWMVDGPLVADEIATTICRSVRRKGQRNDLL